MRASSPRLRGLATAGLLLALSVGACGDPGNGSPPAAGDGPPGEDRSADERARDPVYLETALRDRLDELGGPVLDSVYGDTSRPRWVSEDGLTDRGRDALARLEASKREGLDPRRYGAADLQKLASGADDGRWSRAERLARLETGLSRGVGLLARDLSEGRLPTTGFEPGWEVDSTDAPLPSPSGADELLAHLDSVRPEVEQYARLTEVLDRLRARIEEGGWAPVPESGGTLSVGDSAAVVTAVRTRLRNGLGADERRLARRGEARPAVLDSALARGLARFQERHRVRSDGVLGPATRTALNVSAEDRALEVEVALERWRWLPAELGTPAILVNTPGRRLHVMEDGRPALSMKVIVGERDWETTLFQDEMERMVVNPYWIVPENILEAETFPKAREDPEYMRRNGFEVVEPGSEESVPLEGIDWEEAKAQDFPYLVRQKPGNGNALGTVKFLFPNRHAIYLHDTPADHLFDERLRTFSHGCVRVEEPGRLARYLLRETTDEPPERFAELRDTGERHVIPLEEKVPTYLIYQTVWVGEDGAPEFTPDVYERNGRVLDAFERVTRPPTADATTEEDS